MGASSIYLLGGKQVWGGDQGSSEESQHQKPKHGQHEKIYRGFLPLKHGWGEGVLRKEDVYHAMKNVNGVSEKKKAPGVKRSILASSIQ